MCVCTLVVAGGARGGPGLPFFHLCLLVAKADLLKQGRQGGQAASHRLQSPPSRRGFSSVILPVVCTQRLSGQQNSVYLTLTTVFLPFLLHSFFKAPRDPLKKKRMQMEIMLEAEMNIVLSHGILATWGQTIFYFGQYVFFGIYYTSVKHSSCDTVLLIGNQRKS